jgi:hypothetical protein
VGGVVGVVVHPSQPRLRDARGRRQEWSRQWAAVPASPMSPPFVTMGSPCGASAGEAAADGERDDLGVDLHAEGAETRAGRRR